MRNIKYTESASFKCLENLKKTFLDLYLIHAGTEHCVPSHICPGPKDEYIIHFVITGKGTYTSGNRMWQLSGGDMFLIYPNEYVIYSSDPQDPWFYAWIGFHGIQADTIVKNCGFSDRKPVNSLQNSDIILDKINLILQSRQLTVSGDLNRQAFLLQILAVLCKEHTMRNIPKMSGHGNSQSSIHVSHAIEYIEYSYQNGINVADIADYTGISRTYLNRVFQKELGISVQHFLINYCLHKAANLLLNTDLTICEIARSVGYDDPLAFSKAFKRKFEFSPKNYREHKDQMEFFTEKQPWET